LRRRSHRRCSCQVRHAMGRRRFCCAGRRRFLPSARRGRPFDPDIVVAPATSVISGHNLPALTRRSPQGDS
jgi:hypothetical protein